MSWHLQRKEQVIQLIQRHCEIMLEDIWVIAQTREGVVEKSTFGLIGEARRLFTEAQQESKVTVVVLGVEEEMELAVLASYGADKVISVRYENMTCCEGELHAEILFDLCQKYLPYCVLMCQTPESLDLGPRLAALLETSFISGAMDLQVDGQGNGHAVRAISNGYLFEELRFHSSTLPVISFQPAVLTPLEEEPDAECQIITELSHIEPDRLKTRSLEFINASAENLDLEDADIIVVGGRGVGKGEEFAIIHQLAEAIGGSVGGSRPVIDVGLLPFERQIGQTGKTVGPRLLIACGVSGANELTVGFEDAEVVVAINTDQRARIFRFADLSIVGDVQQVLPLLLSHLQNQKDLQTETLPC